MKILFVIESFYPFHDASAKVLNNLLSSKAFDCHEIHVLAIGQNNFDDGRIIAHSINYEQSLFYKAANKILKGRFVPDRRLIRLFKTKILDLCQSNHIKNVVFVLGNMNFLKIDLCDGLNVNYVFYDTFINNFFYKKEKLSNIITIQNKAFGGAKKIFLLEEYKQAYLQYHPNFSYKFESFFITAFYDYCLSSDKIVKGLLLHTGAFFENLRKPDNFFNFLETAKNNGLELKGITLGELPKSLSNISIPENLYISNRLFGNEYIEIMSKAEVLVLIDNCKECVQIPSKAYEYIGCNKKILFFTEGDTNTSKLLDGNKNVFMVNDKIDNITINEFYSFLLEKTLPERDKYYMFEKDYVAKKLLEAIE